ncbi:hypothetical protein MSAN_00817900 [Mycena sanguinolenta]|uniref:F-box domain-containing protein n=1 Tax=Mycena sanguinolenta TaxID=230812 RepID=A0A8H6YUV2_9AGAR|nr:hypothetical protein MSAN_00817900 [Mycena sanguinolenta]
MTAILTLPQELIVEVIDCLRDDFDALKACSLVSCKWVPHCRSYLFDTCVLFPTTIVVFNDLLSSPDCTFSSHMCKIKALRYSGSPVDHIFDDIAPSYARPQGHPGALLSSPQVDTYPYFCSGFIAAFPQATRLDLDLTVEQFWESQVNVPPFETISLFPALRELHIPEMWQNISDSPTTRVPPHLHCLKLRGSSIPPILTWLDTSNHLQNVNSLSLSSVANHEASIRAAMPRIGGTLRHLDVHLDESEVDMPSVFDLALHPNLETLIIRGHADNYLRQSFNPEPLFRIVKSLAATTLAHLTLELDMVFYENSDWAALDAFLSTHRFPNLRGVVIQCSRHGKSCRRDYHPHAYAALASSKVFQVE